MPNPSTLALEEEEMVEKFITKDSGQREEFSTGARRDVQEGKPKYSLLPAAWLRELALTAEQDPDCRLDLVVSRPLVRVAAVYGRGAKKYGDHNWQRGIPLKRVWDSMARHVYDYALGDRSEDHAAQAAWNAFALMWYEDEILAGRLPRELDDLHILPEKG